MSSSLFCLSLCAVHGLHRGAEINALAGLQHTDSGDEVSWRLTISHASGESGKSELYRIKSIGSAAMIPNHYHRRPVGLIYRYIKHHMSGGVLIYDQLFISDHYERHGSGDMVRHI